MAVKSKKKVPAKKTTPKLVCELEVDCRTPLTTEASGRLATSFLNFQEKLAEWKASGSDEPFNPKHFPNVSKGAMTLAQLEKLDERELNGEDVARQPRYNPILVEALLAMRPQARLRRGADKKHSKPPKDWNEKEYGSWYHLDEDNERTYPSGWFWDETAPRRCHSKTAEKMIVDPDKNILNFGSNRYVVGDGTSVRAAYMLVSATSRANYKAGDDARKRMSLAGNKDALDVVFRIEDRANNGGGVTLKGKWKDGVEEVVVLPGQALTAGFLFNDKGKRLTAKDIRDLDSDTKGLKFKTVRSELGEPIVGKEISFPSAIWKEIQVSGKKSITAMRNREGRSDEYESDNPQGKSLYNHQVTCRVGPQEANPHGFRAACADMVPFEITGGDEALFSVVIGDRSNDAYAGKAEVEESEETPKPKKRATKKSAKKPADAAPPVEVDTADETEEVEEEVEV